MVRRFFRENLAELDFFLNPYSFSGPRWKREQLIPVSQEPRGAKTVELNRFKGPAVLCESYVSKELDSSSS